MDHFNATVHNGALVSTRKGLLISKSKHQGIRFVNAFASEPITTATSPAPTKSSSAEQNDVPSASSSHSGATGGEPSEAVHQKSASISSSKWFDPAGLATPSPAVTATTPTSITGMNNNTNNNNNGQSSRMVEEPFTPMSNEDVSGLLADLHDENHDDEIARALLYTGDQPASVPETTSIDNNTVAPSAIVVRRPAQTQPATRAAGETNAGSSSSSKTEVDNPSRHVESVPALTQRVVSQYLDNVPQESHLYEAIAVVASLTTEAAGAGDGAGASAGDISPTELAASIARVCASMNKDFLADDDGRAKLTVVLESVAALAIDGIFAGQQHHWHVLMKTVRDIVNRSGGMRIEWGNTLNKIRKADIKGAVYAGTSPYLEFDKFFPSIPESLPPQTRAEIATNLQRCLQLCNIHPANIASLQTLAFFAQTIILARHALTAGSHVVIDPQGYAEDCLHVEYRLIKYPQALRADVADSDKAFTELAAATGQNAGGSIKGGSATAETSANSSGKPAPNLLNALVRVAAILYIEDLLPDVRSIDLYSILLSVLTHQIRNIIIAIRQRSVDPQLSSAAVPSTANAVADSLPDVDISRPVLLWTCLIGHAITSFILQNRPSIILDRSAFEDCVALVLSESGGLRAGDMALCEVLPIRELRAVSCDESTLLRQIVAGYEAKQVWNPSG